MVDQTCLAECWFLEAEWWTCEVRFFYWSTDFLLKYNWFRVSKVALVVKNAPANAEDMRDTGSIPGFGRSSGGGYGHSSILAWRIPWTEEAGGLWSIGLHRVRYDWSNLACTHTQLIYNVSGLQKSDSAMHIYIHFHILSLIGYYKILDIVCCAI